MEKLPIDLMVDRFLGWRLPVDFAPDCGINFKPNYNENTANPMLHHPIGTNLFTATQAKAMLEYVLGIGEKAESNVGVFMCGKTASDLSPITAGLYCDCGGGHPLEGEYGICEYGLGGFMRCPDCFKVWNFTEDQG